MACVKSGAEWKKTVKPRPAEIDEWTHYPHDATNNAVSADSVVGPPRQLQWVGSPPWTRSHDHLASVSAAVCAGGRLFYIVDEGPIAAAVLEPKWKLVACDAFSGVVLWKRPIPLWQYHLRGFRSGPTDLARRLVAVGDRVYVTLASDAPLSALDAATGEPSRPTQEPITPWKLCATRAALFVVAGDSVTEEEKARRRGERPGFVEVRAQHPVYSEIPPQKRILAIDAQSGRLLWKNADAETAELMPTTLAVAGQRVFFQNPDGLVCLDAASGKPLWRAPRPVAPIRPSWSTPTLVVYEDVVLSADRAGEKPNADSLTQPERALLKQAADRTGETLGEDAARPDTGGVVCQQRRRPVARGRTDRLFGPDGRRPWNCPCREGYNSPVDVLVADGLVWTGDLVSAGDPGITAGRDPQHRRDPTYPAPRSAVLPSRHGPRTAAIATRPPARYLVVGRSGVEFVDLATGSAIPNHWTRGVCQYGVIPCNGLLYVPPHSCACFITAKLNGFNCLAPAAKSEGDTSKAEKGIPASADQAQQQPPRLERGPAYEGLPTPSSERQNADDWPTYRHDAARSGRAAPRLRRSSSRPGRRTSAGS